MILKNISDSITYEGMTFTIGEEIICTEGTSYYGLGGKIVEIRTAEDKETENPSVDIYVDLIPPVLPFDQEKLNERLTGMNGCSLDINSVNWNSIIMSPWHIKPIICGRYSRVTFFILTEAWADESGNVGGISYPFSSKLAAKAKLNELYYNELRANNIPNDWESEYDEDYIERWEDGYHDSNYYKLDITKHEMELSFSDMSQIRKDIERLNHIEDVKARLYVDDNKPDIIKKFNDKEKETILSDIALDERIVTSLSKNDAYNDAYLRSIDSVISDIARANGYFNGVNADE